MCTCHDFDICLLLEGNDFVFDLDRYTSGREGEKISRANVYSSTTVANRRILWAF